MREIKFKVWDKKINKFIEHRQKDKLVKKSFFWNTRTETMLHNKQFTFLQYTGLKDKNGQEIYEGDVVEVHDFNRHKGVIKFGEYEQDGSAGEYGPDNCLGFYVDALGKKQTDEFGLDVIPYFRETHTVLGFDSIEVIGNIYQHPHLLEGESK